jgi:FkbH-like protein
MKGMELALTEPVRLVIWDLDETFWQGTITEGGHRYNQANHDIVLELARRGIMSSICSKNDAPVVQDILTRMGIWDSFIFPSINWEPKGPRIAALIEAVQLRPQSVLFIDDNPSNINEARHFVPGLQTADETAAATLLENPLLQGKDDRGLTRLAQYKVLEKRRVDEADAVASGGSNEAFLRASNIRVRVERDIEAHLDRAIELINRTNQLNFTKRRLPEEPGAARAALHKLLDEHRVQAGLLEVSDRYGDYGFCGFYAARSGSDGPFLVHFCFSCRVLGMGVEAWTYQQIGRPALSVRGNVLSDPPGAARVDWINAGNADAPAAQAAQAAGASSVAARGGCVLGPLLHYFAAGAREIIGEYNTVRQGNAVRLDHSLCFRHALDGLSPEALEAVTLLGYQKQDFQSRYFDHSGPHPIWVFSNWADLVCPIYRHRATGLRIPYKPPKPRPVKTEAMLRVEENLAAHFEPDGEIGEAELRDNLRAVFSRVPAHGRMFVLLAIETMAKDGVSRKMVRRVRQNDWTRQVAAEFATVSVLDMADFIEDSAEVKEGSGAGHFDRMVYFRVYQHIAASK